MNDKQFEENIKKGNFKPIFIIKGFNDKTNHLAIKSEILSEMSITEEMLYNKLQADMKEFEKLNMLLADKKLENKFKDLAKTIKDVMKNATKPKNN
jgi:hypothetical protein